MTMEVPESTSSKKQLDEAEKNVRDMKDELGETKNEEKKDNDSESLVEENEEDYYSDSSSVTEEEINDAIKEEEEENDDDDAYALLAMAKRSLAMAKETEEKNKAEEEQSKAIEEAQTKAEAAEEEAAEEYDDEEDDETIGKDEVAEAVAEAAVNKQSQEEKVESKAVVEAPVKAEVASVKIEVDDITSDQAVSKSKQENIEKEKVERKSTRNDDVTKIEPPKKRREENAELWALLQASKQRLSMSKHLMEVEPEEPKKQTADAENDTADQASQEKKKAQLQSTTESSNPSRNHQLQSNNNAEHLPTKQSETADDDSSTSSPTNPESDAEAEKRRRRKENAELWELLVQSKRRLEITSQPSLDAPPSPTHDTPNVEKAKDYMDDYVLPTEADEAEDPTATHDEDKYDGEDEDEEAIRLSAKELLIAMAIAEEAALSGKDSFQTTETPKSELKRDLNTFSFIKSKCSISGPKQTQAANSEQNANSSTASVTSWWLSAPKSDKMVSGFLSSIRGLRSKATSKITTPYKTKPTFRSPEKKNHTPSEGVSIIPSSDSTSRMIEKFKKSMKDFQETVNTIDSKNAANAQNNFISLSGSGPTVVVTPVKKNKWQAKAAVLAEKNKK